jgi:hypothetical protein
MIPPFTPEGLLPPTEHNRPYGCTRDEVRERFVVERGSTPWRVQLFEGWELVCNVVADIVPGAIWWVWGCFVSAHEDPLFGEAESLSTIVILPFRQLPSEPHRLALLLDFLHGAEERHRVDVGIVYAYDPDHPGYVAQTVGALEFKWRPRAGMGVADHTSKELVPAGYLEVEA